jgi:Rrf2 family transcriptional regulator, iron-sulfur cluster assembly transcription factor
MLSQTAEYALSAMVHLTRRGEESQPAQAEEIAEDLGVPRNYLSKILHSLTRSGLLESTRGPGGGFRVAVDPGELTLFRIIEVFEPEFLAADKRCLLGRPVCRDDQACPAHHRWKAVSEAALSFFNETTLAELSTPNGIKR